MSTLAFALTLISIALFTGICVLIYRRSLKKEFALFDQKTTIKRWLTFFYLSLILLLAADFFIHKHDHIELGNAPEFYAIYGFFSSVMLIFIAKLLRVFIKRNEDYYDH